MVKFGKVIVFGQKLLYSGKLVVFGKKRLYSGKVEVFGKKWLHSGKSGCSRTKVVVVGCIRSRCL